MNGQYNRYYVYENEKQSFNDVYDFEDRNDAITFAIENNMYKVLCMYWNTYEDFRDKKIANGRMVIWTR